MAGGRGEDVGGPALSRTRLGRLPTWTPILVFWIALGVVASLQETLLYRSLGRSLGLWTALAWEGPKFVLWGLFTPLVVALDRRVRAKAPGPIFFAAHLGLAAVLILVHASYATLADFVVLPPAEGTATVLGLLERQLTYRLQFDALSYMGILAGWYALDYFRRHREEERATAQLERELARAELQALKMQMQPHFLFNALQALAVLNGKDPPAVTENLLRLGSLYRYLTRTRGVQEVALRHELDFVTRYLEIEEVRFPDRLRVDVDVPEEILEAIVPHLVLQPLVENALRHGVAPLERESTVTLRARRERGALMLEVLDDGAGPPGPGEPADGVGLRITRARLRHLHGEQGRLEVLPRGGGGTVARVRIPFHVGAAT